MNAKQIFDLWFDLRTFLEYEVYMNPYNGTYSFWKMTHLGHFRLVA